MSLTHVGERERMGQNDRKHFLGREGGGRRGEGGVRDKKKKPEQPNTLFFSFA